MNQELATKNVTTLEEDMRASINSLAVIDVVDADTFARAGESNKAIVALKKKVVDYWGPIKDSAHKTWKGLVAKEKEMLDPIDAKQEQQRLSAKAWADAEEAKRREEQRKAEEAVRKQAEDEQIARAAALEKDGNKADAEAEIAAPVVVPQVVVPSAVPQGFGRMTTKYYSATVTDIKLLAKAVIDGKVPVQAIQGNDTFLNGQARMLKETMNWPGVKVIVR